MPAAGIDPDTILVRTAVVSVTLQALVAKLLQTGAIGMSDVNDMRRIALDLGADMIDAGQQSGEPSVEAAGHRIQAEALEWWKAALSLAPAASPAEAVRSG